MGHSAQQMKHEKAQIISANFRPSARLSSGASGGSLHGDASFKVEKAHLAAEKRGPENRNMKKFAPPSVPPPEALYETHNNHSAPQRCNAERSDAQRIFSHRYSYPLFYSVIAVMPFPVLQRRRVNFLTSRASPFGLCFHFSFRHHGLLYKTRRISPRVTTQRCHHWQRGMAIANANANVRCFFHPTFHAKWPKPIFGDFNGFAPDSCRFSIDFDGFPVIFNQFQSILISFNQFQSV